MLEELRTTIEVPRTTPPRPTTSRRLSRTTVSANLPQPRARFRLALDRALRPDPNPLFRIMRSLWRLDARGQPLLALLVALARDPLLAATASAVVPLEAGEEFGRGSMRKALRDVVGSRLNDDTLDKVARNAASSWSQAGHLSGRTFKVRRPVQPTFAAAGLALLLAYTCGTRGDALLQSDWLKAIDCQPTQARVLAIDAKRHGLVDLRMAGDVIDVDFDRMDPWKVRR